jgi:hypothetical protein
MVIWMLDRGHDLFVDFLGRVAEQVGFEHPDLWVVEKLVA